MARRAAREAAMKLLYQQSFSSEKDKDEFEAMIEDPSLDQKDNLYIDDILVGTFKYQEEIDAIIRERAIGWQFNRISRVDLSILRLALYEILHREDIPESVSINEGVELAKKFGSEKSGVFINGILGTFMRNSSK